MRMAGGGGLVRGAGRMDSDRTREAQDRGTVCPTER